MLGGKMIVLYAGNNNTGCFLSESGNYMIEAPKEVVKEAERMMVSWGRFSKTELTEAGIENVLVPSIQHVINAVKACRRKAA